MKKDLQEKPKLSHIRSVAKGLVDGMESAKDGMIQMGMKEEEVERLLVEKRKFLNAIMTTKPPQGLVEDDV